MTFSFPDDLADRLLASVPPRQRSATLTKLLEAELFERKKENERELIAACLAANANEGLNKEMDEWQAFEDDFARD